MDLEEEIILDVIQTLNEFETNRAIELLNRIILIVNIVKSPIDIDTIKEVWFPELQEKERMAMEYLMADGHEYSRVGYSSQLSIFRKTSVWYSSIFPNKCLYYILAYDPPTILRKLTKENLRHDFKTTRFEQKLDSFLRTYKPFKRNFKTGEFRLFKVFEPTKLSDL